jgi:hypothetical protein
MRISTNSLRLTRLDTPWLQSRRAPERHSRLGLTTELVSGNSPGISKQDIGSGAGSSLVGAKFKLRLQVCPVAFQRFGDRQDRSVNVVPPAPRKPSSEFSHFNKFPLLQDQSAHANLHDPNDAMIIDDGLSKLFIQPTGLSSAI